MARCDCIQQIEDGLKKKYSEKENVEKVSSVSLNTAFIFTKDNGMQLQIVSPVEVEYDYRNKKGDLKHKKEKASMCFSYCPFCGQPYEK